MRDFIRDGAKEYRKDTVRGETEIFPLAVQRYWRGFTHRTDHSGAAVFRTLYSGLQRWKFERGKLTVQLGSDTEGAGG